MTEKMVGVMQKKGNKLENELVTIPSESLVCEGAFAKTSNQNWIYLV